MPANINERFIFSDAAAWCTAGPARTDPTQRLTRGDAGQTSAVPDFSFSRHIIVVVVIITIVILIVVAVLTAVRNGDICLCICLSSDTDFER